MSEVIPATADNLAVLGAKRSAPATIPNTVSRTEFSFGPKRCWHDHTFEGVEKCPKLGAKNLQFTQVKTALDQLYAEREKLRQPVSSREFGAAQIDLALSLATDKIGDFDGAERNRQEKLTAVNNRIKYYEQALAALRRQIDEQTAKTGHAVCDKYRPIVAEKARELFLATVNSERAHLTFHAVYSDVSTAASRSIPYHPCAYKSPLWALSHDLLEAGHCTFDYMIENGLGEVASEELIASLKQVEKRIQAGDPSLWQRAVDFCKNVKTVVGASVGAAVVAITNVVGK